MKLVGFTLFYRTRHSLFLNFRSIAKFTLKDMSETNIHRLTRDVLPVNYKITLTPNFDNWTFVGSETINLKIVAERKDIILNSVDIIIKEAKYNDELANIEYDCDMGRAMLRFNKSILPGEGNLHLEFSGTLNNEMKGFYRSTYTDDNNKQIKMAVTQFEASDARRAFPCWDEPNIKASFDVSLIVPNSMQALSNMPEKCRTNIGHDLVKVEFDRTPIMSTYILAFVIGDLDFVESKDSNGVKVRVYTAKNKSARGKFALDVCCRTLPFYATYFGIAYPLPKMDLVAIPDFAAGAMENWGLVTYRETMLLVDEHESSAMCKQIVALVVGHECAHMWFGNLVTMDWWTDLWLNEGFATWIEYLCVDYCYPEFDIWTNFVSDEYAHALSLDSLKSSHPIQVTVHKPSEVEEIFDAISYSKGACVIRMLNEYIGNVKFKAGLSLYLNRHKYKNAVTEDLWKALSEASGESVTAMMDTWTKQTGFPVVSVESVQDGHGNTVSVTLQQRRFLAATDGSDTDETYWLVPVTVCSINEPDKIVAKVVMAQHGRPQTFPLTLPVHGPVRINPGAIGFYHVQYQDTVLPSLVSALSAGGKLGPRDRLCLVMDSFALARSGAIATTNALDLARGYKAENNYTVWSVLLADLKTVSSMMDELDHGLSANVNRFLIQLIEPVFKTLGWDPRPNESHNDRMLRPLIIRNLGKAGHEDVVAEARRRFDCHHEAAAKVGGDGGRDVALLAADIRSAVYLTVLKHGEDSALTKMMELLKKTDLHEERMRIMGSLGAVPLHMLPTIHEYAFSDEVRKQDKYRVLLSTVSSAQSRRLFWQFMVAHWEEFRGHISNNHMLGMIIKSAFEDFVTEERYKEVSSFFVEHPTDVKRSVDQTLENIKINIAHLARDQERLTAFYGQY